jgi:hypothetical protein
MFLFGKVSRAALSAILVKVSKGEGRWEAGEQ